MDWFVEHLLRGETAEGMERRARGKKQKAKSKKQAKRFIVLWKNYHYREEFLTNR
jgi:hypothetical protein